MRSGDRSTRARRQKFWAPLAGLALILAACQAGGGDYPDQEITIIVPFAAGGPTDTVTRLIAEPMAEELGVEIVVQNVEGAGGTVAAEQVANAEADGYTVLMHHIGMSTAPTLYPDLAYDPLEDFEMIGLVTEVPMTFIGSPEFEPTTMEELDRLRRGEPRHGDLRERRHRRGVSAMRAAVRDGDRPRPDRGAVRRHRPGDG